MYCDFLKGPEGGEELTDLMDVISTNVTSFFREAQCVLPARSRRTGGRAERGRCVTL